MNKLCVPLTLFIVILFSITTSAQNQINSLEHKSYKELKSMYYKYEKEDSIPSKKIINTYLNRAKKEKDTFQIAEGYLLFYYETKLSERKVYLDSILSITQNNPSKKHPALAYFEKAKRYLYDDRNIEETIKNLAIAKEYSSRFNNTNLSYRIDYIMGVVRSEHLGEKKEAITIFKECAQYYSDHIDHADNKLNYIYSLHAIAETYIPLKKYDSVSYYNRLGYMAANKNKKAMDNAIKYYFTLCEGINQYSQDNFEIAIDSINIALPKMIDFEDTSNTIDSYFYLGKSYYDTNKKEKAIRYFIKTDSLLETLTTTPQYKHVKTYEYLKNYYTAIDNTNKRNHYLNKLNSILDKYLNDKVFISKKVKEDYDVPQLLEEQKKLIRSLNKVKNNYSYGIIGLLLVLAGSLVIAYRQNRKKKLFRQRFEELIKELDSVKEKINSKHTTATESGIAIKVPEKHINYILKKLDEFEKADRYLNQGITIQSLANEMQTNSKYLSRVINHYKKKKFTSYINELRITYAVKELKENDTLRKFTIKAIANEMGFVSTETFTNAFYKQVSIKPSYFIKQLEKNS